MSAEFAYDVFLSHDAKDKPRVRRLAEGLRAAGLRVWFDEWNVRVGEIVALKVNEGLQQARVLLLCISPNALASSWVTLEHSTAIHRDPANVGRRFIPLLLADCKLPDTLRLYHYLDFRSESEAPFEELLAACRLDLENLSARSKEPLSQPLTVLERRGGYVPNATSDRVESTDGGRKGILVGILKKPEAARLRDEIAPYAFSQILRTVSSDTFRAPSGCLMTDIVNHLDRVGGMPSKSSFPSLLCFAVLCRDLCPAEEPTKQIALDLEAWISNACRDTDFTIDMVRSILPQQEAGRVPRLAIEIAWPPRSANAQKSLWPEAYARWGNVREQLPVKKMNSNARHIVAEILMEAELQKCSGGFPVDHVELLVELSEMEERWECKSDCPEFKDGDWHPFPTCVRLISNTAHTGPRACPIKPLGAEDIIKIDHPRFHVLVVKKGVFVGSSPRKARNETTTKIHAALPHSSIALWSRDTFEADNQEELLDALLDFRVEDIPRVIHNLRSSSVAGQVWRDVVLLFDPNLPPFKFANSAFDARYQRHANAALS